MDGLQNEILVFLLYVALIYELVTAIKRRASKTVNKMKTKFPRRTKAKGNSDNDGNKISRQDFADVQLLNSVARQSSRHFVQMRLVGRD